MYTKIYFNESALFLADEETEELRQFEQNEGTIIVRDLSQDTLETTLERMYSGQVHAAIILHNDLEELKTRVFRMFTMVPAAGGLVVNEEGEVLMIFRRGHWDLPKGKLDPGETIEECARREVMEETGLHSVTVWEPLLVTYHTYMEKGERILKDSHWYRMSGSSSEELSPQLEEQITEIRWVKRNAIKEYLKDSFPSIRDVLRKAGYAD